MSTNHPLFEPLFSGTPEPTGPPFTGADLRDSGIQQALEHLEKVKAEYIDSCLHEIQQLSKGATLTSEDLREMAGEPPTGCENSIAGILKRAQSRGLIANTGEERPAKRVTVHAKGLRIWRRI
jgi:hypothetical protein